MSNQPNSPLMSGLKNNIGAKLSNQLAQVPQQLLQQVGGQDPNMMSLFGFTMQKKYFYLLGLIVVLVVGYLLYTRWNNNKKKKEEDEEEDPRMPRMPYPHFRGGRLPPGFMPGYPPMGGRRPQPQQEQENPEEPGQDEEQIEHDTKEVENANNA
jgi:hypothetical protein